ncbi:lysoplasmalogenase [Microbacterium sp. MC2]
MTQLDAHPSTRAHTRWWGFWLYAAVSLFHVAALIFGWSVVEYPSKLALMPALALAVIWALRGTRWPLGAALLVLALAFSWLGDGAAAFFPFIDETLIPMLACFGIAHLLYIALFVRPAARRPVARWSLVYVAWWIGMLILLWPHLGALAFAVAGYGLVLGGTAAASTRGSVLTAIGGAFFLASDTILSIRLFWPDPTLFAGGWVMATYTLGQGLLALGIVRLLRDPR